MNKDLKKISYVIYFIGVALFLYSYFVPSFLPFLILGIGGISVKHNGIKVFFVGCCLITLVTLFGILGIGVQEGSIFGFMNILLTQLVIAIVTSIVGHFLSKQKNEVTIQKRT